MGFYAFGRSSQFVVNPGYSGSSNIYERRIKKSLAVTKLFTFISIFFDKSFAIVFKDEIFNHEKAGEE